MISSSFAEALRPLANRMPRVVREHEILRVAGELGREGVDRPAKEAKNQVLKWAQARSGGRLPEEAWAHQSFEFLSGGRNCVAIRIESVESDIWGIRAEDPDKEIAGRIWTTEVTIGSINSEIPKFSLRLLASTREENLFIEPHTPGLVRQVAEKCGISSDSYLISASAWQIDSIDRVERLIEFLVSPDRRLPIIILSVQESSDNKHMPLLDPSSLAPAVIGLAHVAVLPAEFTWHLTERFGKRLSVFGGAMRVYLPGFTEDADPYGEHKLVVSDQLDTKEKILRESCWLRAFVASESIRRTRLDKDVVGFSTIKNVSLRYQQQELVEKGASEGEQLVTAKQRIDALEEQIENKLEWEQVLSDLHGEAEERAQIAEAQLRSSTFRIQQLIEQVKERGSSPDENMPVPNTWDDFAEWCETNLVGRVVLSPRARRGVKSPKFEDVTLTARCLIWLANECRNLKLGDGTESISGQVIEPGYINEHCGGDEYEFSWQGKSHKVEWHIKNGGNTRDPTRCLRIYYFWDDNSRQFVVADMPAHRDTSAS